MTVFHPSSNALPTMTPRRPRRSTASSNFTPVRDGDAAVASSGTIEGVWSSRQEPEPDAVNAPSFITPTSQSVRHRRISTNTLSPFQPISSPEINAELTASLARDWKSLYRDRYELEKRWQEGRFTTRKLKDHQVCHCFRFPSGIFLLTSRSRILSTALHFVETCLYRDL